MSCVSLKSANYKKIGSAKCHICRRFSNLANYWSPQICGFAICGIYLRTAHLWRCIKSKNPWKPLTFPLCRTRQWGTAAPWSARRCPGPSVPSARSGYSRPNPSPAALRWWGYLIDVFCQLCWVFIVVLAQDTTKTILLFWTSLIHDFSGGKNGSIIFTKKSFSPQFPNLRVPDPWHGTDPDDRIRTSG